MKFALRDHQAKGQPFYDALVTAGHEVSDNPDVVLIDFDLPHPAYDAWSALAREKNAALIVYPHGFSATEARDLVGDPIDLDACLVPGPGQKVLLELYDYPNPVHVIGWPQTEPSGHFDGILFAPHHPLGSGFMQPDSKEANAKAFRVLLSEPRPLTVRCVGSLEQNGLWHEDGVRYVAGAMDGSFQTADLVVARGTYAANCLQAGATVITYEQDGDWRLEAEDRPEARYPAGWRQHRDFTRYPYDLAVCQAANPNSPEVQEWRARFMPPFDPQSFVRLVEETIHRRVTC